MTAAWRARAACREHDDIDMWFDPARFDDAKRVCRRCPVRSSCLADAIANGEQHGVWGGRKPSERSIRGVTVTERERLIVLSEVRKGAASVHDVVLRVGIDASRARRHLYRLELDGLVKVTRPTQGLLVVTAVEQVAS